MKLWREHYAPQRIALDGSTEPLNAVASRSDDGKTLYVKAVNPAAESVRVQLTLNNDTPGKASLQLVAPGDLAARNTLEARDTVRPQPAAVQQDGATLRFTLPPISCGVVEIRLE
jgi:alpha-L-arabinofuranosidase